MKKVLFSIVTLLMMGTSIMFTACSKDDNKGGGEEDNKKEEALAIVNKNYVNNTVIATYKGLATASEDLAITIGGIKSDADVEKACNIWKTSRQYWEWSEAFLFGAASNYSIDPHIDTWPFDRAAFDKYMAKYHPATDEDDAAIIDEAIATGQNLTGFHAVEYLLFRDGKPRKLSEITDDELYFMTSAATDLFLNACRLEAAWAGIDNIPTLHASLLEETEMEPADNFGEEFVNAGQKGSRWASATLASVQIIEGAQDIIGEVRDAKIGSPATGEDPNYIESPHAYNSIQDFYDNTMSCVHAMYGNMNVTAPTTTPAAGSLMAYCTTNYPKETTAAYEAFVNALKAVDSMKKPFVLNFNDASAKAAMEALDELDGALDDLKTALLKD
ncbi:MAG: hypothetical protein MJZ69_06645 [Bacteroidaceae bacterium]|nr:hypothetical protein [Bacteroidaceae bacterium]MDO4955904.1 imelysin family protein [Bacteroidales bacterium]